MASSTTQLSEWASSLRVSEIPDRVVTLVKSQVLSQLAAIRAGLAHPSGRALVRAFGPPLQEDPRQSACVLAGLGSWLNLDDTAYAGHLSNSTVAVPLAYAYANGLDGAELITAITVANECAARITACSTLGQLRGQMATQTSLVGSVSGRLRSENAPARRWVDALGLALAMPPWPLAHGYFGSDARVLSAFVPVRMGMDACDAAAEGLVGAPDIIEHSRGFLAKFATVPVLEAAAFGLGQRWHTETLSFKVRPSGPGTDAAVDCAIEISDLLGHVRPEDVVEVVVDSSAYTVYADRLCERHTSGDMPSVSSLPISVPYTVATALLNGDLTVSDFTEPAILDDGRWALARKVRLVHDGEMTRKLFSSEAPFGEAIRQVGPRAAAWIEQFAEAEADAILRRIEPPSPAFTDSTKKTAARVTVRLADGRSIRRERDIPVGAAGPDTKQRHAELVRRKFLANGGSEEVADGCAVLDRTVPTALASLLEAALVPG